MTAPAIALAHVDMPDLTPVCESEFHGDAAARPAADVWIDQHGCRERFWCCACLQHFRALFIRYGMHCQRCGSDFFHAHQAITKVVPLR